MGRGQEVPQGVVYPMEVAEGVKNLAVTRGLRAELCIARPMEVVGVVSFWDAPRVQKGAQICALPTAVVGDALAMVALELHEGSQACVSGMVEAKDARKRTAQRVPKACQVFASRMEAAAAAIIQGARKGHRGALCFVRLMVGVSGARSWVATRVLKGAPPFAKVMVGARGAPSKVGELVPRVCMVAPISAWLMGVGNVALCLSAQEVRGVGPIFVYVMVGAKDVNLMGAARVLKEARIIARPMVVGRGALGDSQGPSSGIKILVHATLLLGERRVSVHSTVDWCRIEESMGVSVWGLYYRARK